MARRFYNLPPLTALSAFEAAARHRSFRKAAEELNVTPGAVSHQIKALEEDLGVDLFLRVHRGVDLTEAGKQLFRTTRAAFLDMATTLDAVRSHGRGNALTVGATTAMSALWLTPVISRFGRHHPDARINQVVSDLLGFGPVTPELVISYGPYHHERYEDTPLFRDTLVPVCAPGLLQVHKAHTLKDLLAMPLIHLDAPDKRWTSWKHWFAEMGHVGPLRRGVTVNNYMVALQAAQDGAGMVLGWRRLVAPYVRSGALVPIEGFSLPAPTQFYLSRRQDGASRPGLAALADWVIDAAQLQVDT